MGRFEKILIILEDIEEHRKELKLQYDKKIHDKIEKEKEKEKKSKEQKKLSDRKRSETLKQSNFQKMIDAIRSSSSKKY